MRTPESAAPSRTRAVLHAGLTAVEWLEEVPGGQAVLGRAPVLGSGPGDLAQAAAELVRSLGRRPRECVLVLADELLQARVLSLPQLTERELRLALRRKAANLCGSKEAECAFGALHLGLETDESRPAEDRTHKWLLIAQERARLAQLEIHLRRRGLRVRRILPARLASLGHRAVVADERAGGRVVVGFGPDSAVLSLIHGDALVHQTILAGRLGAGSALGMTLIQELRGLDLFWRKHSRGTSIGEVVLVGAEPEDATSLGPALHAALPGARVGLHPDAGDARIGAGRAEALAAALRSGPFTLDLCVPIAPRAASLVALTVLLGLAAAVAGRLGVGQIERHRYAWQDAGDLVRELTDDLPALTREIAERERALSGVELRRRRLEALAALGIPLEEMLLDLAGAFEGRGHLATLALTHTPNGLTLDATGETSADPLVGYVSLEELRRKLERSAHFRDVTLTPPAALPEVRHIQGETGPPLSFGLRAAREVPR